MPPGTKQFAIEFEVLKHGVFTHALLEALSGENDNGDSKVTVNELKLYMEERYRIDQEIRRSGAENSRAISTETISDLSNSQTLISDDGSASRLAGFLVAGPLASTSDSFGHILITAVKENAANPLLGFGELFGCPRPSSSLTPDVLSVLMAIGQRISGE